MQSDVLTAKGNEAMAHFCELIDFQRTFYGKSGGFAEQGFTNVLTHIQGFQTRT